MRLSLKIVLLCAAVFIAVSATSQAEQGLERCADRFPDSALSKAPQRTSNASQNTVQLCERSGDAAFFALEYDPDKLAPLWVAYRITDRFGPQGCASMTRKEMACYFREVDADACAKKKNSPGDPFHTDDTLAELGINRITPAAFGGTGHDRGHMAPNNTFSWHACGAYKTFTMANMAAQWGSLNRELWADLEAQVLFWGVKDGPIHVVTGPIWAQFPSDKFEAIRNGEVSTKTIPKPGTILEKTNGQKLATKIPRPTGFYKVVFRPGRNGEPARAIAFLAPHTKQKGLSHWQFLATVELVEDASGLRFGLHDAVKAASADLDFWRAEGRKVPNNWTPRTGCNERLPVTGRNVALSIDQRVALCNSTRPAP